MGLELGKVICDAHDAIYQASNKKVSSILSSLEKNNQDIETLTRFLTLINQERKNDALSLNTEEQRATVDAARALLGFEEFTYHWEGKEKINSLVDETNLQIRTLSNQSTSEFAPQLNNAFSDRKEITECFKTLLESHNKFLERVSNNVGSLHP